MERRVLGLPLLSVRSVNPTADAAVAAATVPLPTPEREEGSPLSSPMPPLQQQQEQQEQLSPSPITTGAAATTASARSLGTRLSRLEESVAAMDEKMDRVLRLLSAMATAPGSDMQGLLPLSPSAAAEDGEEDGSGGAVDER